MTYNKNCLFHFPERKPIIHVATSSVKAQPLSGRFAEKQKRGFRNSKRPWMIPGPAFMVRKKEAVNLSDKMEPFHIAFFRDWFIIIW